jgi:mevalonate kinase
MQNEHYYSNGKLLISGEYVVLDGALSLAIPTKYGQSLSIEVEDQQNIIWNSLDEKGMHWFQHTFERETNGMLKKIPDNGTANKIVDILNTAKQLNSNFLNNKQGIKIMTSLTFPRLWGLGTSSTLINNIAMWAKVDAYTLLEKTFGGSGYDIACAQHNHPICYHLENGKPIVTNAEFNPPFKEHLYFIYLNKKQNSRDGISHYKKYIKHKKQAVSDLNKITLQMVSCKSLEDFESLMVQHETIISNIITLQPIKKILFNDFNGEVKSLGAWGGDFVMATCKTNPLPYFKNKGFDIVIPFNEMVL